MSITPPPHYFWYLRADIVCKDWIKCQKVMNFFSVAVTQNPILVPCLSNHLLFILLSKLKTPTEVIKGASFIISYIIYVIG